MIFFDIAGWIGTSLVLLAYFLISSGKITGQSRVYQLMNLVGVIGVGMNVFVQHAWPALALQISWGLIAIYGLVSIYRTKKPSS